MKRLTLILIPLTLLTSSLRASTHECLEAAVDEMNDTYRTGAGCEDGIFNAVSSSMLGWGIGLFAGIALLTGLVHNSHQDAEQPSSSSGN